MPWEVKKEGDQYCVHNKDTGRKVACHPTQEKAEAQMRALYVHADGGKAVNFLEITEENPPMNEPDVLIYCGGAVKALGDGKVGGYLVEFSDPATKTGAPDLDREYFAKDTDYDLEEGKRATVYFDHGRDPVLKRRKLGKAPMKVDDVGVWIEHQLNRRDQYENALYQLAELGKLGWSSGSAPHLVEKKSVGGFTKIVSWPLGDDASLTPEPASYTKANHAVALKSVKATPLQELIDEIEEPEKPQITTKALEEVVPSAYNDDLETHSLKVATAVEESIAHFAKSFDAVETLKSRLARKQEFRFTKDGRPISAQRARKMNELADLLDNMINGIGSTRDELRGMAKLAEATREQRTALQEAIQLQHQTFQQLKESYTNA